MNKPYLAYGVSVARFPFSRDPFTPRERKKKTTDRSEKLLLRLSTFSLQTVCTVHIYSTAHTFSLSLDTTQPRHSFSYRLPSTVFHRPSTTTLRSLPSPPCNGTAKCHATNRIRHLNEHAPETSAHPAQGRRLPGQTRPRPHGAQRRVAIATARPALWRRSGLGCVLDALSSLPTCPALPGPPLTESQARKPSTDP